MITYSNLQLARLMGFIVVMVVFVVVGAFVQRWRDRKARRLRTEHLDSTYPVNERAMLDDGMGALAGWDSSDHRGLSGVPRRAPVQLQL